MNKVLGSLEAGAVVKRRSPLTIAGVPVSRVVLISGSQVTHYCFTRADNASDLTLITEVKYDATKAEYRDRAITQSIVHHFVCLHDINLADSLLRSSTVEQSILQPLSYAYSGNLGFVKQALWAWSSALTTDDFTPQFRHQFRDCLRELFCSLWNIVHQCR